MTTQSRQFSAAPNIDLYGYLLGVTVPVGPGMIRAAYWQGKYDLNTSFTTCADPKADKLALVYVHNLSKRTALYAAIARIDNKNGAALTVSGLSFFCGAAFTPKRPLGAISVFVTRFNC